MAHFEYHQKIKTGLLTLKEANITLEKYDFLNITQFPPRYFDHRVEQIIALANAQLLNSEHDEIVITRFNCHHDSLLYINALSALTHKNIPVDAYLTYFLKSKNETYLFEIIAYYSSILSEEVLDKIMAIQQTGSIFYCFEILVEKGKLTDESRLLMLDKFSQFDSKEYQSDISLFLEALNDANLLNGVYALKFINNLDKIISVMRHPKKPFFLAHNWCSDDVPNIKNKISCIFNNLDQGTVVAEALLMIESGTKGYSRNAPRDDIDPKVYKLIDCAPEHAVAFAKAICKTRYRIDKKEYDLDTFLTSIRACGAKAVLFADILPAPSYFGHTSPIYFSDDFKALSLNLAALTQLIIANIITDASDTTALEQLKNPSIVDAVIASAQQNSFNQETWAMIINPLKISSPREKAGANHPFFSDATLKTPGSFKEELIDVSLRKSGF